MDIIAVSAQYFNSTLKSRSEAIMVDNNTTQTTVFNEMDKYFMGIAFLAAKQSEDPVCKVGACIVDDKNEVVSVGYNDMPEGTSWKTNDKGRYVCHAEFNAINNRRTANFEGCKMYVTLSPCNECAKLVIRLGIKRVIYLRDLEEWKNCKNASNEREQWKNSEAINDAKAAKNMLNAADISCE